MSIITSIRRYLPSPPGSHRRRLEVLADEVRQVRAETRRAQDRFSDAIGPLVRVSEHFPLMRRELDDFVQSLSVTLRQASDRIREVDERLDDLLEQSRGHGDALAFLQANQHEPRLERTSAPPRGPSIADEQLESLRSAVDRLAIASARAETLLEELLDRPVDSRSQAAWLVAMASAGVALIAIVLATFAYLK